MPKVEGSINPLAKTRLGVFGEQVDRAVSICTRVQFQWGLTTRLWEAAYAKQGYPLCLAAAEMIVNNVSAGDTVLISSGWVIPPNFPRGIYNGFAGTSLLARAINIGLGARVLVVTDDVCVEPFIGILRAGEMKVWDQEGLMEASAYRASAVASFPVDREEAKVMAVELFEKVQPKVLIAIERSDENEAGVHHTASGTDMSKWTAKVQYLFREANERRVPTIGIIDIGNEIGGAFVRDAVRELVTPGGIQCDCPCGGSIAGVTPTTIGVVARSSNAGAYGIAACLAALLNRCDIFHDRGLQKRVMDRLIDLEIADGPTRTSTFTEDGAPGELTLNLIDLLQWLIQGYLNEEKSGWDRLPFVTD